MVLYNCITTIRFYSFKILPSSIASHSSWSYSSRSVLKWSDLDDNLLLRNILQKPFVRLSCFYINSRHNNRIFLKEKYDYFNKNRKIVEMNWSINLIELAGLGSKHKNSPGITDAIFITYSLTFIFGQKLEIPTRLIRRIVIITSVYIGRCEYIYVKSVWEFPWLPVNGSRVRAENKRYLIKIILNAIFLQINR